MTLPRSLQTLAALVLAVAACGTPAELGDESTEERLTLEDPLGKADAVSASVTVKGSLDNGGTFAGKLPLGETWGWKFTIPADTYVRASIFKTEDAPFYPAGYLYGPVTARSGGKRLAVDRARDAAYPQAVLAKAGTYIFVVQDPGGTWPAKFALNVDWVESPCAGVRCEGAEYACGAGARAHLCHCDGLQASPVEICDAGAACTTDHCE